MTLLNSDERVRGNSGLGSLVGFVVWPQKGHIYPTFHLARRLIQQGARVVYYGSPKAGIIVSENGFEFRAVGRDFEDPKIAKKSLHEKMLFFRELVSLATATIKADQVTHLFVDPIIQPAAIAGVLSSVEVTYFWVMNPPYRRGRHLPFRFSRRTPNVTLYRLFPRLTWLPQWVRYRSLRLWQKIRNYQTLDRMAEDLTATRKLKLVLTSYGYRLDLPAIVLGPRGFAQTPDPSLTYLGLGVDASRREELFVPKSSAPLVYVSLGGNFNLYPQAPQIIEFVLKAASNMPEVDFVVQIPGETRPNTVPGNVTVVTNASTLSILTHASAALVHGGYGTIKECIASGVPMLLVPFMFDQPNNAAKVSELGLGRVVFPRQASADQFRDGLRLLLENGEYRKRIESFREAAVGDDAYEAFCSILVQRSQSDASNHPTSVP